MVDEQPDGADSLRERFPWVGLVSIDETDLSSRCREIMAESRRDREIVEAIESVRHSA